MSFGEVARSVGPAALVAAGLLVLGSGPAALARQGAVSTAQPDPRGLSPPVVASMTVCNPRIAAARRMPLIQQQTVGGILGYLPQMMAGVEDSYCSRVKCTRAEKKAFDDVSARMAAEHPAAAG